jgi:ribosomal protein L12E/L44/L45/RPP1/RPP2
MSHRLVNAPFILWEELLTVPCMLKVLSLFWVKITALWIRIFMAVLEKLDEQIARKQEKLDALKARKQAIENRQKAKAKEQERKAETRRKILVGAEVLKRARNHPDQYARVLAMMDETLTREDDRNLFALEQKKSGL